MKTADLIPFILWELKDSDKYGLEITKNIETKSNSVVVIKQPTLYTVLKKLEKSKFISSYWEDSEIGGKRHYYKLTENGKLQVSTLPTYQELLNNLSSDENNETSQEESSLSNSAEVSIMDALLETPTPIESVIPTEEVFAENNIDNSTLLEINTNNAEVLKSEAEQKNIEFAENEDVSKFTAQKETKIPQEIKAKLSESQDKIEILHVPINFTTRTVTEPVEYVNYINIKSSEPYKKSKKIAISMLMRSLCTSAYLVLALIISFIASRQSGTSPLFYSFFMLGIISAIFYPVTFIFVMDNFRLKVQEHGLKNNLKLNFFIALGTFLFVLVLSIFVNIAIGNGSIVALFAADNFANFYAPLFITSSVFVDYLFNCLFMKKLSK